MVSKNLLSTHLKEWIGMAILKLFVVLMNLIVLGKVGIHNRTTLSIRWPGCYVPPLPVKKAVVIFYFFIF